MNYRILKLAMRFFNKIKYYLIVLLWSSLYIYFRFFRRQTSYEFLEVKYLVTQKFVLLQIGFIIFHIILISYTIFSLCFKTNTRKTASIVIYFNKLIENMLIIPFTYVLNIIGPKIPYSGLLFCSFAKLIQKKGLWITKVFIIVFSILPQIIVCIVFTIEILYYHRIHYFISFLPLLVLPLLGFLFINLFTAFGKRALIDIPKYVTIIPVGDPLPNGWYTKYRFEPKPEYKYNNATIAEYRELYFLSMSILVYGEVYLKVFRQKAISYCILCTSTLYVIGTAYKLYFILV